MIYLLNPVFQGHSPSVIRSLHIEIARLEEIKKANIEKFVNTLRNELHGIWDDCFYSPDQRNLFSPLHSIDFTEDLLELHEAEVAKMKSYVNNNKELFDRVAMRQEVKISGRFSGFILCALRCGISLWSWKGEPRTRRG